MGVRFLGFRFLSFLASKGPHKPDPKNWTPKKPQKRELTTNYYLKCRPAMIPASKNNFMHYAAFQVFPNFIFNLFYYYIKRRWFLIGFSKTLSIWQNKLLSGLLAFCGLVPS